MRQEGFSHYILSFVIPEEQGRRRGGEGVGEGWRISVAYRQRKHQEWRSGESRRVVRTSGQMPLLFECLCCFHVYFFINLILRSLNLSPATYVNSTFLIYGICSATSMTVAASHSFTKQKATDLRELIRYCSVMMY